MPLPLAPPPPIRLLRCAAWFLACNFASLAPIVAQFKCGKFLLRTALVQCSANSKECARTLANEGLHNWALARTCRRTSRAVARAHEPLSALPLRADGSIMATTTTKPAHLLLFKGAKLEWPEQDSGRGRLWALLPSSLSFEFRPSCHHSGGPQTAKKQKAPPPLARVPFRC